MLSVPRLRGSRWLGKGSGGRCSMERQCGRQDEFKSEASGPLFFDSNILLYADDARFPAKQKIAGDLIFEYAAQNAAVVSLQVLQEYYSNATRKLGINPAAARQKVEIFSRFHLVEPELANPSGRSTYPA